MTTSASGSPTSPSPTASKVVSTQQTLTAAQKRLQQQLELANQAGKNSLIQHEARLNEHMQAALDTFKADIESRRNWLLANLIGWPLIALTLCTALAMGGVWGWWKLNRPYEIAPYLDNGKSVQMKVLKEDYPNTCPTPAGERPCKPLEQ